MQTLQDVITRAIERAGGAPFSLGWLMAQPGVRDAVKTEARAQSMLRDLTEAHVIRVYATHPERRWQEVSGS